MTKTATKTRALTLRPHEARRLAEHGRVLIVRACDHMPFRVNDDSDEWRIYAGRSTWASTLRMEVRVRKSTREEISRREYHISKDELLMETCPFGPVGSELWGRESFHVGLIGDVPTIDYRATVETDCPITYLIDLDLFYRLESHRRGWRSSTSMPLWASRFPRLILAACEVKRAGEATRADAVAMGLPDGPWEIVKPGSAPIEYMEIKPADMLAGLAKLPAERWCWFATIERADA